MKEHLKPLPVISRQHRLPLEHAIDIVESLLGDASGKIERAFLCAEVNRNGYPEVLPYVDQALKVMIHHGSVRRLHPAPGCMAYERTERWSQRDEAIGLLRGPKYKKRIRVRVSEPNANGERRKRGRPPKIRRPEQTPRLILGRSEQLQLL